MVLARDDGGVQHARDAVLRFLGDELPVTFIRDAVLLTGELASNAIAHSVGQCGLEASFSVALGKLRVEITDQSSEMPSLSTAEPFGRAAGMGLQLVARPNGSAVDRDGISDD